MDVMRSEVSVNIREVAAQRFLVGGFSIAQRVQASMPLVVGNQVVVPAGSRGTVLAEYTDTRLTVVFESSEQGVSCFNVLPMEILPWCSCELPPGTQLRATQHLMQHLMGPCGVVVPKGTRGTLLGGVDQALVFVAFENGCAVAAAMAMLELDESQSEVGASSLTPKMGPRQGICMHLPAKAHLFQEVQGL